jgi:hypothetical protein
MARPWCGCRPVAGSTEKRVDLLGRVVGDRLDVHAAFGGGDEGDAAGGAVDQQGEVEFLGDVDAVGDVEAVDLLAFGPVWIVTRVLPSISRAAASTSSRRAGEADAALGVGAKFLELALAAAAGVDLRLDDVERPGELVDGGDRFLDAHRGDAGGHRGTPNFASSSLA